MASASGMTVPPVGGADPAAPTRIKRNTACIRCRDAKVKCNASLNPSQPCLRCSKLDLDCLVDKGHKRTSRRSKLEELAAELDNLKRSVVASGPSSALSPPVVPPLLPAGQPQSPYNRGLPFTSTEGVSASTFLTPPTSDPSLGREKMSLRRPSVSGGLVAAATRSRSAGHTAEPRALASCVFSGEDIVYYFEQYFEHFHPFMPIICLRDPDACYTAGPVLFWAIIVTSCRRYAKNQSTFQFLVDAMSSEISATIATAPVSPSVISALLIFSTWSLPTMRFMNDPGYVYTGIALNSALYLGFHTGKGDCLELGTKYDTGTTDEEARYIWAASNIVSQRTSNNLGFPSTAPFTGTALHGILDATSGYPVPTSFRINLATARFSNRLYKAVATGLDAGPGISYHFVDQMEEEFLKLHRSLHDGTPDINDFMLRSTLLEVQVLYWMALSGRSDGALSRDLTRAYETSRGLLDLALDLERRVGFLAHAPHYIFRSLVLAACCVVSYLRSPFRDRSLVPEEGAAVVVQDVISALRACSVQAEDLPTRVANVVKGYWTVRDRLPPWDISQLGTAKFRHRLGASIVFECLGRWKKDLDWTRASAGDSAQARGVAASYTASTDIAITGHDAHLGLSDPLFQGIDWSSFMDDFEWNIPPSLGDLETHPVR